jgi:hypothetical protein
MHLSDHSLRQIDDDYVRSLETDALRDLSLRLLADLKEARERLNQGPANSSRPPSSRAPWERGQVPDPIHEPPRTHRSRRNRRETRANSPVHRGWAAPKCCRHGS